MILSNTEIEKAIVSGEIKITPLPHGPYNTTAMDLRLGSILKIPKEQPVILDPSSGPLSELFAQNMNTKKLSESEGDDNYTLEPNKFILAQTLERIELNYEIAARVEGKSSLARCGLLVHFTAPTIHAGFQGNITLEIINLGRFKINLRYKMPICQLIFECVKGMPTIVHSQFQGQSNPIGNI